MSLRHDVLKIAQHYAASQKGKESGKNNQGWLPDHALAFVGLPNLPNSQEGYAWCAAFVSLCVGEAMGFDKVSKEKVHQAMKLMGVLPSASVSAMKQYAINKNVFAPSSHPEPQRGWLVIFRFSHIGVLENRVVRNGQLTHVVTTDGNTSPSSSGSQRDGQGSYSKKKRPVTQVAGYIRIP